VTKISKNFSAAFAAIFSAALFVGASVAPAAANISSFVA